MNTPTETPTRNQPEPNKSRVAGVWFALRLIEVRLRFVAVLVAIGLTIGYWDTLQNYWERWTRPPLATAGTAGGNAEFYCPMDPSVVREGLEPNGAVPKCPICGMPLSLRKKGAAVALSPGVVGRVSLTPDRIQMAGIRSSEIGLRPMTKSIRTVGTVAYDESLRSQIVSRVGGYVEKLFVDKTFSEVSAGDLLAEVYSPELYAAVQELRVASSVSGSNLAKIAREKIHLLGIDEREIDSLLYTDSGGSRVVVRSPSSGVVIRKTIQQGSNVAPGQMLFEVADLSSVWIEADVYERDLALLKLDQEVEATVEAYPQRVFKGRVSLIYPELDAATRTNRVRFSVANSEMMLRAGMYATVKLDTPVQQTEPFREMLASAQTPPADPEEAIARQVLCPVTNAKLGSMGKPVAVNADGKTVYLCCAGCEPTIQNDPQKYLARLSSVSDAGVLAVPESAVIDTGSQKIVYVEREEGVYEGIEVQLGPRADGYYAVISGLLPGDRVAAAGAFLIDAETRLNPAASAGYFGASGGPASSEPISSESARSAAARSAATSSEPAASAPAASELAASIGNGMRDDSNIDFATARLTAKHLSEIAKLAPEDQVLAKEQVLCPITKQPLGSMGKPVKVIVKGQSVLVCCKGCIRQVEKEADAVLRLVSRWRESNRRSQAATK